MDLLCSPSKLKLVAYSVFLFFLFICQGIRLSIATQRRHGDTRL